ncbi:PDZ domain-containing protein [Dokdonella sp.]|uniref:PDZ domain-containing protein n=1 Tax=Dokdonella sp. TaxID=2291710 RepID=UPI002D80F508|nr:PDZ domain-containing protein [Dokdonella sp.]
MLWLVAAACAVLGGCATMRSVHVEPALGSEAAAVPEAERYSEEPGRDAATVAAFRAAPPSVAPQWADGADPLTDRNRLGAEGYAHVGTSRFARWDERARTAAAARAQALGADRALLYAGTAASEAAVAYYVRFRLPFGATFRDLREDERAALGRGGVRIGSVLAGTPAEEANLIGGDVVVAIGGIAVADRTGFQAELRRLAGRRVMLELIRNGETLQRSVRLGAPAQP